MKISVVLSTYNGEKYIIEQLDSLKRQTRKIDEVLIIDDCSSDQTFQIIEKYISDNCLTGWKLSVNEKNLGWRENFMRGLWNSTGDLVFTCDQDDIWNEKKIEILEKICIHNSNIELLTSGYTEFYENGRTKYIGESKKKLLIKQGIRPNFTAVPYPGCTYCISRSLIDLSKKYWEVDYPHDSLFWRLAMFRGTLYTHNESLIYMRKHSNSTFTVETRKNKTRGSKRNSLDYASRVYDGMLLFLNDNMIPEKKENIELIFRCKKWNDLRKKFYDTHNVIYGIQLLPFLKYYPKRRTYISDWYWGLMHEKEN